MRKRLSIKNAGHGLVGDEQVAEGGRGQFGAAAVLAG
jgi:hypothetical protein